MWKVGVLILTICLILLVSGCTQSLGNSCEDNARKLIPKNLTLEFNEVVSAWVLGMNDNLSSINYWLDGTNIGIENSLYHWESSSKTGQNINYIYMCEDNIIDCYHGGKLTYSKQVIDENGKILGNNVFTIRPVLRQINGTEGQRISNVWTPHKVADNKVFEIVEIEFLSCNLVGGIEEQERRIAEKERLAEQKILEEQVNIVEQKELQEKEQAALIEQQRMKAEEDFATAKMNNKFSQLLGGMTKEQVEQILGFQASQCNEKFQSYDCNYVTTVDSKFTVTFIIVYNYHNDGGYSFMTEYGISKI